MKSMKRILFLAMLVMVISMSMCSAGRPTEIPIEEIAIGGIDTLAPEAYVRSVYGEPDEITYENSRGAYPNSRKIFRYGDSFFIMFDAKDGRAWSIKSTGNNGLATPAGFAVGSDISDVIRRYGKTYMYSLPQGGVGINYANNWYIGLTFKANREGKIYEISAFVMD